VIPPAQYPYQGDVWEVDLNPIIGHEQRGKTRPCVVISTNDLNAARWVVFIVPMTSKLKTLNTRDRIPAGEGGQPLESDILCEQIRAVDIHRLVERLGSVDRSTLESVSDMVGRLIAV
jgi:mRNA interferase MazF